MKVRKRHSLTLGALGLLIVMTACGGGGGDAASTAALLSCDESLKSRFKPDADTSVIEVKAFRKGDPLTLAPTAPPGTPAAGNDICMVKLNVGPGNPGPAGAPSTSPGIGIEVWLPTAANWNERIHALGGGGWQGGGAGSATVVANPAAAEIAGKEGAVSSFTDTGHAVGDGSFAMKPDGTINTTLWIDFASRSLHEQAVKTKALTIGFYGRPAKYSYFEGGSTGGRQGLNLAQNNPAHYDGIIANYPAINWSRFITHELYPQIVFQRDLGGTPLTQAQQDLLSNAAVAACDIVGGQHLGYILDPSTCTYDPTKDASVLCTGSGGTNTTSSCVTTVQARAVNKIWHGMTVDGSVPDPQVDNGWGTAAVNALPSGTTRWFGQSRGTSLYAAAFAPIGINGLTSPNGPFPIAADQVALELQNPTIAEPTFRNASGNGQQLWKSLSYAQLANAYDRGVALQLQFGNIDTNNPDLSAFKARGGKLITWHGFADELIPAQGTVNYYTRVAGQMGGMANVQSFYKLYLVPAQGHGTPNGTSNPNANPPSIGATQMYELMTNWVEKGTAPDTVVIQGNGKSRPICVYPKKATYTNGDINVATSYTCS